MVSKFIAFATVLATARAGLLPAAPLAYSAPLTAPIAYSAPISRAVVAAPLSRTVVAAPVAEEYDPNPQYTYGYDVQDSLTGDSKSQYESRSGDVVQGSYSVVDPDGTKRTVDYTADPLNGFNAVVRKEPLAIAAPFVKAAPVAIAHSAPLVAHAAPVAVAQHVPLAYAAPVARLAHTPLAYSAPIAKLASPIGYSLH